MLHILNYKGRTIVVDAIKEDIERGDYFLVLHENGSNSIELCESTYASNYINENSKYHRKIVKANRAIHSSSAYFGYNVSIIEDLGKDLERDYKIDKILAK